MPLTPHVVDAVQILKAAQMQLGLGVVLMFIGELYLWVRGGAGWIKTADGSTPGLVELPRFGTPEPSNGPLRTAAFGVTSGMAVYVVGSIAVIAMAGVGALFGHAIPHEALLYHVGGAAMLTGLLSSYYGQDILPQSERSVHSV